jgi:hypothetical protein
MLQLLLTIPRQLRRIGRLMMRQRSQHSLRRSQLNRCPSVEGGLQELRTSCPEKQSQGL